MLHSSTVRSVWIAGTFSAAALAAVLKKVKLEDPKALCYYMISIKQDIIQGG